MVKKQGLSTEPYKGVRDFYPDDMRVQNHIFSVMRRTAESFGFVEYNASILEPAELYEAKSGEEIVNEQTYTFVDRGDRRVTLRPEMTPSVARMVAARRRGLPLPLRWYSIPNCFRYERPQRGRVREHWQLNADIFGVSDKEADAEIISLAYHIMRAFGASPDDFVIKIGSRTALQDELKKRNVPPENHKKISQLIDKKGKIPEEERQTQLKELGGDFDVPESDFIALLRARLAEQGIANTEFDPDIIRGFDYYTDMVFEVFDTSPENNRSLFGGGRYDNLLDIFGMEPIPAAGFGMGDVTMRDFLETHNLLPECRSTTHLFLCTTDADKQPFAAALADRLRAKGVNVAVNLTDKKVGDQITLADKQRIPFVICIGEEETKNRIYKLKNLNTKEEQQYTEDNITAALGSLTSK